MQDFNASGRKSGIGLKIIKLCPGIWMLILGIQAASDGRVTAGDDLAKPKPGGQCRTFGWVNAASSRK